MAMSPLHDRQAAAGRTRGFVHSSLALLAAGHVLLDEGARPRLTEYITLPGGQRARHHDLALLRRRSLLLPQLFLNDTRKLATFACFPTACNIRLLSDGAFDAQHRLIGRRAKPGPGVGDTVPDMRQCRAPHPSVPCAAGARPSACRAGPVRPPRMP